MDKFQYFRFGVQAALADARALAADRLPTGFTAQVYEPERKLSALMGADRMDSATIFEKQAVSIPVLSYGVTAFPWCKVRLDETPFGDVYIGGDIGDLPSVHAYDTRRAGAAISASPAREPDAVIEKIAVTVKGIHWLVHRNNAGGPILPALFCFYRLSDTESKVIGTGSHRDHLPYPGPFHGVPGHPLGSPLPHPD